MEDEWDVKKQEVTGFSFEDFQTLFTVEMKSAFHDLLKDENRDLLDKFVDDDITFDMKEKISKDTPALRFAKIDRNVKKSLQGDLGSKLIHQMEREICPFLNQNEEDRLVILFSDPFCRMLGHNICKYYTLASASVNTKDGRVTVIRKTKATSHPGMLLSEYLHSTTDFDFVQVEIKKITKSKTI